MDDVYKKLIHRMTPPRHIQIKIITCFNIEIYATWQSMTNITSNKARSTYGMSQRYIFHKQMVFPCTKIASNADFIMLMKVRASTHIN
ncbi:unnamed protein product [Malus baccata var. baccata]